MRDVLPTLRRWQRDGRRFALATVVHTWGSSPRPIGSTMGVDERGSVVGSVSGGCVETAVMQTAMECLASGEPKMLDFGALSDESAWEVGLSCGGRIQVLVEPFPDHGAAWVTAATNVENGVPCALVMQFDPSNRWVWTAGSKAPTDLAVDVWNLSEDSVRTRQSRQVELGGREYFILSLPRQERIIVVGAVHIAIPLVALAHAIGLETIVVDPRGTLADPTRFTVVPDQIVVDWPEQALSTLAPSDSDFAVVLTHDPKIDDSALAVLLKSPVRYVGALGSRSTQEKRRKGLKGLGFSDEEIARIHGPVGLAIGARTPEEIAVSIIAEIVQARNAES